MTPLVFLHGFLGSPAEWQPVVEQLPWAGPKQAVSLPLADSWQQGLQRIAESLPAECILVGYSLGARVALAIALAYPRACKGCASSRAIRVWNRQSGRRGEFTTRVSPSASASNRGPSFSRTGITKKFSRRSTMPREPIGSGRNRHLIETIKRICCDATRLRDNPIMGPNW